MMIFSVACWAYHLIFTGLSLQSRLCGMTLGKRCSRHVCTALQILIYWSCVHDKECLIKAKKWMNGQGQRWPFYNIHLALPCYKIYRNIWHSVTSSSLLHTQSKNTVNCNYYVELHCHKLVRCRYYSYTFVCTLPLKSSYCEAVFYMDRALQK